MVKLLDSHLIPTQHNRENVQKFHHSGQHINIAEVVVFSELLKPLYISQWTD